MKLSPEVQLQEPRESIDTIHACATEDWDANLWVMACGVSTIAAEDGTLSPDIDFYDASWWWKATCSRCRAHYGRQESI